MSVTEPAAKRFTKAAWTSKWLWWASLNACIAAYFTYGLVAPASNIKTAWLPGKTTHGHHQIEMDCDACHAPSQGNAPPSASDVMQDACIRCHGDQLKAANDTHPASKFNDPTNADRLAALDAQNCLTCHQEHVPDRTLNMGLTLPADYCWHCHQEVAENRPSHAGMAYDSCATAGCHNYHDNRALYEKFLDDHFGEPDLLPDAKLPLRDTVAALSVAKWQAEPLQVGDADAPEDIVVSPELVGDWAETAHAAAGVNCTGCHGGQAEAAAWSDKLSVADCETCHEQQVDSFQTGKHGMRIAAGLPPMTPSLALLPMHAGTAHESLDCNACHPGHRFDTEFAAVDACLRCHADSHSLAYRDTTHASLWEEEVSGSGERGTGVSCATCHLPRLEGNRGVWVNHDQNASLRPSETMAREVCMNCHGLDFALNALADPLGKTTCYGNTPERRVESVQMAHDWFTQRQSKRRTKADQ
ncbi:NrfA- nitrite reduction protein [Roseiconus nitratireducens]|uniref:nitrite reductase (cytochrome; ammonia-forming) n=1 Tax=Roseiconus nitratireducens TaxID=2605748 RepID=A0A5M6CXM8_9BACT|nr:cytochrome c3 family protein [Roseiconus nitratireducens]KAA5539696.1 NrfA- nitrite reduction protein [Roseiconus nitratireducens]